MGHPPPYPPYSPGPPPSRTGDRVVSIIVLVVTALALVAGAFAGLMLVAFLDYCPAETCSVNGAVASVMTSVALATAVAIAGLVLTSVRLSRGRTAWPYAVGALVLCGLALGGGLVAYQFAVGW